MAADTVIDLRIIASTASAEAGLARVGATAESELGSGGKLGKAGKEAESSMTGIGKSAAKADEDVKKGSNNMLSSLTGLSLGQGVIIAGFAAAALVAHSVFDEYNKLHDATVSLKQAMRDAGEKDTPVFEAALKRAQQAGEDLGFEGSAVTQALANMTQAGLTTAQALAQLPQVEDLARAKGEDLATATQVITKGINGAARGLKEFGVVGIVALPTFTALTAAHVTLDKQLRTVEHDHELLVAAQKKYGDSSKQAATASYTLQSAQDALKVTQDKLSTTLDAAWVKTHNLAVIHDALDKKVGGQARAHVKDLGVQWEIFTAHMNEAGAKVIPIVNQVISDLLGFLSFLMQHLDIIGPVIGTVIAAFVAYKVITETITGVTKAFAIVQGLLNGTMDANPIMLVVAAVALLVGGFIIAYTHIKGFRDIVNAVFGFVVSFVKTGVGDILGFMKGFANVLLTPWDILITAINFVIGLLDKVHLNITIPGWVPLIGGKGFQLGFSIPQIPVPHLYTGGIALGSSGGSLAVVGDKGQDEAIIPLPKNWRTNPGGMMGGGGKGVSITQYIQTQATPDAINRAVLKGLRTSGVTAI